MPATKSSEVEDIQSHGMSLRHEWPFSGRQRDLITARYRQKFQDTHISNGIVGVPDVPDIPSASCTSAVHRRQTLMCPSLLSPKAVAGDPGQLPPRVRGNRQPARCCARRRMAVTPMTPATASNTPSRARPSGLFTGIEVMWQLAVIVTVPAPASK